MSITLNSALVIGEDGHIDQEASVQAFRSELVRRATELELEEEAIASAVASLFDKHFGASINMPAVCSMTATLLNVQPENYNVLVTRIADYVRKNSQETKDENKVVTQRPDSLFVVQKGANGGCHRRGDREEKPVKAVKAKASK